MFCKFIVLLTVIFIFGCNNQPIKDSVNANKQVLNNSIGNQDSTKLEKSIDIIIGRGVFCCGHIISIDTNGKYTYLVGEYIPEDSELKNEPPENFDINFVKQDKSYKRKSGKLSTDKINKISRLIKEESKLLVKDKAVWTDSYIYQIYFDKKLITYGYNLDEKRHPENLIKLIRLIEKEIGLHELPGMA
jgi:hypothetical protein